MSENGQTACGEAADAIREWATPDDELGWVGSQEVAQHAQEIADFLWERGLTRWGAADDGLRARVEAVLRDYDLAQPAARDRLRAALEDPPPGGTSPARVGPHTGSGGQHHVAVYELPTLAARRGTAETGDDDE